MRPAEVLKRMKELKEEWSKQNFRFSKEQQAQYDKLRQLRYERVSYFLKNGIVSKGGLRKKEVEATTEDS